MSSKSISKKAEAIVKVLWLFIGTFVFLYFLDTRIAVESMAQDYPSTGLNLFARWAPLLFPLPLAYYLSWVNFPKMRRYLKFFGAMVILLPIIAVIKILSAEEISFDMSMIILGQYLFLIIIGSVLVCDSPKHLLGQKIDEVKGWNKS